MISQESCQIISGVFVGIVFVAKYLFVIFVAILLYGTARNYMIMRFIERQLKRKKEGVKHGRTRKKRD